MSAFDIADCHNNQAGRSEKFTLHLCDTPRIPLILLNTEPGDWRKITVDLKFLRSSLENVEVKNRLKGLVISRLMTFVVQPNRVSPKLSDLPYLSDMVFSHWERCRKVGDLCTGAKINWPLPPVNNPLDKKEHVSKYIEFHDMRCRRQNFTLVRCCQLYGNRFLQTSPKEIYFLDYLIFPNHIGEINFKSSKFLTRMLFPLSCYHSVVPIKCRWRSQASDFKKSPAASLWIYTIWHEKR